MECWCVRTLCGRHSSRSAGHRRASKAQRPSVARLRRDTICSVNVTAARPARSGCSRKRRIRVSASSRFLPPRPRRYAIRGWNGHQSRQKSVSPPMVELYHIALAPARHPPCCPDFRSRPLLVAVGLGDARCFQTPVQDRHVEVEQAFRAFSPTAPLIPGQPAGGISGAGQRNIAFAREQAGGAGSSPTQPAPGR